MENKTSAMTMELDNGVKMESVAVLHSVNVTHGVNLHTTARSGKLVAVEKGTSAMTVESVVGLHSVDVTHKVNLQRTTTEAETDMAVMTQFACQGTVNISGGSNVIGQEQLSHEQAKAPACS